MEWMCDTQRLWGGTRRRRGESHSRLAWKTQSGIDRNF